MFSFQYYVAGRPRYIQIGAFTGQAGQLPAARVKRDEYASLLDQGIDPKQYLADQQEARLTAEAEKRRQQDEARRLAAEDARMGTVQDLFTAYTDNMRSTGKRTADRVHYALKREALPIMGCDTKARDVTTGMVVEVLHALIDRGAETQANRIRSYLMTAFNFGIQYDNNPATLRKRRYGFTINPVLGVPKQKDAERVGERDLSPEEIHAFFQALPMGGFSPVLQSAIRLCFATGGQRPNEILSAEWSEFNFETSVWELPSGKAKNKKAHLIPLTEMALLILAELPGATILDGNLVAPKAGGYLFPNARRQDEPMLTTSMSRAIKRYCDRVPGADEKMPVWGRASFVPRDIRRTCKTQMGALGISKETRDRINNHAINDVSARHYDRYDYLAEKRAALEIWCGWLCRLTVDKEAGQSNVIELSA